MALRIVAGTIIADRYQVVQLLGEGTMGSVWEGMQLQTGAKVALKFLKASVEGGAQPDVARRRMRREARAASSVRHPNVALMYDLIEHEGSPVLVMELLEGESLGERLARAPRLTTAEACSILARVASALGAARSANVVHRDLKPDNIFLCDGPRGPGTIVKVLDFGIAKILESSGTVDLTGTGVALGSPHYMAPEQTFGEPDIDPSADIWSLGVIAYQALSGVLPTRADTVPQVIEIITRGVFEPLDRAAPGLPAELGPLVARMLAIDPPMRPSEAEVEEVMGRCAKAVAAGG